jgi:hypothetical protein
MLLTSMSVFRLISFSGILTSAGVHDRALGPFRDDEGLLIDGRLSNFQDGLVLSIGGVIGVQSAIDVS